MVKVPNLEKFRGDNEQSFNLWIKKFEAQCAVLDISDADNKKKWRDVLLILTDGEAFDTVSGYMADDANVTYATVKGNLSTKYTGENYKRYLEMKLRNLRFTATSKIPEFLHAMRSTIKEYYNITVTEAVDQIAMSVIFSNLDISIKSDVQILQLAGNTKLENVLELVSTKLRAGFSEDVHTMAASGSFSKGKSFGDRLGRLEELMEQLVVDREMEKSAGKTKKEVRCTHCSKSGHDEKSCFLLRKCFKCSKMGHISRYCPETTVPKGSAGVYSDTELPASERMFLKVAIGETVTDMLYDTGSMYTMVKREVYEKLQSKPKLIPLEKSGIGATGHQFKIDGVAYLNLKLLKEDGSFYTIEYEPVLVSEDIVECYYGMCTERRFEEISRNSNKRTLTCTPKDNSEKVSLKYYVVNEACISSIKVAKSIIIPDSTTSVVKGRLSNFSNLKDRSAFALLKDDENSGLQIPNILLGSIQKTMKFSVVNTSGKEIRLKKGERLTDIYAVDENEESEEDESNVFNSDVRTRNREVLNTGELNEVESSRLQDIIVNYERKMLDYPETKLPNLPVEHRISLKDDEPVYSKPHRLSHTLKGEVERQVDEWLEKGFVEPSYSPYGAPLVPVKKKNGTYRICGDFRKLNAKTIPAKYPIPNMEDLLIGTGDSDTFSTIDLKNAYHHIQVAKEDRHKTACVTENRKFHWVRMPYGLTGASYSLTAAMQDTLKNVVTCTKTFYDDILVHTKGRNTHLEKLKLVFSILSEHGIHVNMSKCEFMKSEVKYLGHIINSRGILPEVVKIDEIVDFKTPSTIKEVKSFLGMAGFYKKFIKDFSMQSQPMFNLLKKAVEFKWTTECEKGFQYIKSKIITPSLLFRPDFNQDFVLQTDAADGAIGYVLMQYQEGEMRPILYGGRVLTDAERRYATIDKELLAVYYAVKRNEVYILGRNVTVYTDHKPLTSLRTFRDVINKRYRWISFLEEMGVIIRYIEGDKNVIADYISRHPKQKLDVIRFAAIDFINKLENINELREEQHIDETLIKVINAINNNNENDIPPEFKRKHELLSIEDGLLMYNHHGKRLIVAPQTRYGEILAIAHSHFSGGHFGIFKCHRRILEKVWWPKLYEDVKKFINNCEICIKVKHLGKNRAKLGKTAIPCKPMELVSIDYLVNLPATSKNNIHIMVVSDHFSKFIQVYPCKDRTAKTASVMLVDYILRFGTPMKLYSDQDPSYEAELFQKVAEKMGVRKLRSTPYNPQANGLTEQSNHTIKNYLTSYVNENKNNWDKYCRELALAYNTSVHKSTGFTPAQLFFGRRLNTPLDLIYGEINNDEVSDFTTFTKNLQDIYEHARKSMGVQQEVSATYYDKKVRDSPLECNDLVYVYLPRNRRVKLAYKWMGPAKIVASKHPLYKIKTNTKKGESEFWTIRNKLKKAPNNAIWPDNQVIDETQDEIQKSTGEVEVESSSDSEGETELPNDADDVPEQEIREPYGLRDRRVWGRNYYGMGAYIAMLEN